MPVADDELEESTETTLAEAAAVARAADVPVQTRAVRGSPPEALVEIAAEVGASLIVVGNQGLPGVNGRGERFPHRFPRGGCNVLIASTDTR